MTPPQEQDPALTSLDPLPGRVIAGNFRIDRQIGSGAMGNVYRAVQLSLGKPVAIKVLHQHLMGDDKLVGRFKREAKSASLLNHPNSIQIIDSGQDSDGLLYIAMELLDGRDLAQVLRDDFPLPLPRIVRILTQVLSALEEAHAQGVIHRDLKPSNIMLTERRDEKDFVKVCDFGIAKATLAEGDDDRSAMLTIQGLVCGTPEYMSPEQARAEPLDGRADLYSAAVILYQLVTGDIPFRADSPMGIVSRHLAEPPVPPSVRRPDLRIPSAVDEVVLRGLEKSRELRFASARAFRDALERMLNATLGPPTPLPPSVRAVMPTAPAMPGSGSGLAAAPGSGSSGTGKLPEQPAAERFGTTANLAGRPRRARWFVLGGPALALAGAGAIALFARGGAHPKSEASPAAAASLTTPALPTPAPAPPASAPTEAARAAPHEGPTPPFAGAMPDSEAPTTPAKLAPALERDRGKRIRTAARDATPSKAAGTKGAPVAAPALSGSPAAGPAVAATPPATAPPVPRGPREVLAEAEKLLGQGEVAEACARGEEAKRLAPRVAPVHKFLGKCYMRAGRTREANESYKQYLELAPTAPDAPFIKGMIK